jgi:hypothetical protein
VWWVVVVVVVVLKVNLVISFGFGQAEQYSCTRYRNLPVTSKLAEYCPAALASSNRDT